MWKEFPPTPGWLKVDSEKQGVARLSLVSQSREAHTWQGRQGGPWPFPHVCPFSKAQSQCQKLVTGPCTMQVFLLRYQSNMPVICSPSCHLPLIPCHPNFLSQPWTVNDRQEVEGVYRDAFHPPECGPHIEALLAGEKAVGNPTSVHAGDVHFQEHPQLQTVRDSSSGMKGPHFRTAEPQNLLSVSWQTPNPSLSDLRINKQ